MPNTLAHLGIQGVITRTVSRDADLRWIYLGCVIPDLPWIVKRGVLALLPQADSLWLGLYFLVQSTLILSLVLSGALAAVAARPGRTFLILAGGSLMHLLLDACQSKWGNGALLLAPWDWRFVHFDLFPMDSLPTYGLTLFGLVYFLVQWRAAVTPPRPVRGCRGRRLLLCTLLLLCYFAMPLALLRAPLRADTGYVKTWQERAARPGKFVELDRGKFVYRPEGSYFFLRSGERLLVDGISLRRSAAVSARGTFSAVDRLNVVAYVVHPAGGRDAASVVGLALVSLCWLCPLRRILAKDGGAGTPPE